ncbi:PEP phosphonomutase [Cenarchaeum symbiosum A]|uniref:PEP phosphonomutase n=1 Tax=Cenarchaeum symbiosum (strain A) TaxID=414004 RepID=A0RYA7_CENSY|nr:PEP phosphonomutase [Cenarchaeum symbiosum A]
MLSRRGPLVVPGVYDALGARIAEKAGFGAIFQTGYGTAASLLGMPDYGFIGAAETVSNARRICGAASVPVLVDADTGYGNALSVWRLVGELEAAGASGMFLEDQRWPKRCGHMGGKEVVPYEEYAEKLGAAVDARSSRDFVIVARTDARATEGLDAAIERGIQNRKNGADAVFIEAPASAEEMRIIGRSIRAPLVANMIEGGRTPTASAATLDRMGFKLILYPLSMLYASSFAALRAMKELKKKGSTKALEGEMMEFDAFNDLVGLSRMAELEGRYGRDK